MKSEVISIEDTKQDVTYDIWNKASDCLDGEGNYIANGIVVHNSILANGVRNFNDLLIFAAMGHPGPMQCCWEYSKVDTKDGQKFIRNLRPDVDEIKVLAADGKIVTTNQYLVADTGKKKLLEITLDNGKSVIVSEDHRIATNTGWKRASDIQVGEDIICRYEGE